MYQDFDTIFDDPVHNGMTMMMMTTMIWSVLLFLRPRPPFVEACHTLVVMLLGRRRPPCHLNPCCHRCLYWQLLCHNCFPDSWLVLALVHVVAAAAVVVVLVAIIGSPHVHPNQSKCGPIGPFLVLEPTHGDRRGEKPITCPSLYNDDDMDDDDNNKNNNYDDNCNDNDDNADDEGLDSSFNLSTTTVQNIHPDSPTMTTTITTMGATTTTQAVATTATTTTRITTSTTRRMNAVSVPRASPLPPQPQPTIAFPGMPRPGIPRPIATATLSSSLSLRRTTTTTPIHNRIGGGSSSGGSGR